MLGYISLDLLVLISQFRIELDKTPEKIFFTRKLFLLDVFKLSYFLEIYRSDYKWNMSPKPITYIDYGVKTVWI